jgi:hypothetical protein
MPLTIHFNITDAEGPKFTRTYDWAGDVDALLTSIEEAHREYAQREDAHPDVIAIEQAAAIIGLAVARFLIFHQEIPRRYGSPFRLATIPSRSFSSTAAKSALPRPSIASASVMM